MLRVVRVENGVDHLSFRAELAIDQRIVVIRFEERRTFGAGF